MAAHWRGRTLAVAGAGSVGSALARGAADRGLDVRLWNRDRARADAASRRVAPRVSLAVADSLSSLADGADLVVLAVSEGALEEVAEALARAAIAPGVAVHTAGARGPDALGALAAAGWSVGQLHPLAAIAPGASIGPGTWWGLAGDEPARDRGAWLADLLGGRVLALRADGAVRYHLAANLVAGGAVALVDLALGALRAALADGDDVEARRALAGLLASAARNLERDEPAAALTGPQARGSADVVRAHLAALEGADPELEQAYRLLARRMVALARAGGAADGSRLDELERLLGGA